jgi:2-methylcitrate dehydratase
VTFIAGLGHLLTPQSSVELPAYSLPDNLGAIIAVGDWLCRNEEAGRIVHTGPPLTLQTLLIALIKAYEIQGLFLLRNAFNAVGLDHTILVKLASTAVTSWILGLSEEQCKSAISHVWMDASPLRVYRSGSNTIPRKGWAAGDACMRAVQFALVTKKGQPGAPTVLTQPRWGFYTTAWRGRSEFELPLDYGSWVVEHVFFKVMPVEGHGISAVEAALVQLRRLQAKGMTPEKHIRRIRIRTCAAAKLIIDKAGTLHNAADRDHCMQYVVSVALLKGSFPEHTDYSNTSPYATSPEIERLSSITEITTDDGLTRDYMDLEKRSLPSGVTLELMNGEVLPEVLVEYPAGHPRHDQTPDMLRRKFHKNMSLMFSGPEIETIERQVADAGDARISGFIDLLSRNCSTRL